MIKKKGKVFHSPEEFERFYLPNYCKKHPIVMRLTEEEANLIRRLRGETWRVRAEDKK